MTRTLVSAFAFALTASSFAFALPATAAPTPQYQADLAAAAAKETLVAKQLIWKCDDTQCVAAKKSPSRPIMVCAALAKQVGTLTAFRTDGVALDAAELARCNASA